ncbi:hypothetical protein DKM44_09440 [Deinococcus irradiatisoli]|uniref:DUF697 domain-containing protein n=1 Tax=Deinococcus irradiatisoli TaxID=2202254 RepID=A0A2Z3JE25_9DEIO|nr:DUF697 domain-containing protein [Deinococcus irradiatisoli]AWN23423.1 hypothetical protein DKM44_09440 [Deinococcus irradiatisoli]
MLPLLKQILDNFNFDIDADKTREENGEEVIRSAALLAGAVAVEPLPFADLLLITPLQLKMVLHIGKIHGFDISVERAREIVQELGATIAYGMLARQVMRGLAKLALPVVGGLITAPAVYGWTYALGRLAERYFEQKRLGLPFDQRQQAQVVQEAKQKTKNILPSASDFSDLAAELRRRAEERGKSKPGETKTVDAAPVDLSKDTAKTETADPSKLN